MPAVVQLLVLEQERLCSALADLSSGHRAMWDMHVAHQDHFLNTISGAHQEMLEALQKMRTDSMHSGRADIATWDDDDQGRALCAHQGGSPHGVHTIFSIGAPDYSAPPPDESQKTSIEQPPAPMSQCSSSRDHIVNKDRSNTGRPTHAMSVKEMQDIRQHDINLHAWKECSGLHTVEDWVANYNNHPSPWPALLMIHGVPETTKRLRNKVENYAIYSALLMCVSIEMVLQPPAALIAGAEALEVRSSDWWLYELRRRVYGYGFFVGIASHMLSILLAMAFHNALNEAARDSDVYRMFSRGRAFLATTKCQVSFRLGCYADFLALAAGVSVYIGLAETLALGLSLCFGIITFYRHTSRMLFRGGSLTHYWREETGGKPDADDLYDLSVPMDCFLNKSKTNRRARQRSGTDIDLSQQRESEVSWRF